MSRKATPRYRKRRPMPAVLLLVVLLVVAIAVWVLVARSSEQATGPRDCPPPSDRAAAFGSPLPPDALNDTRPLPPPRVRVRVLNASPDRGEAGAATVALRQHGFTRVGEPGNDRVYDPGESTGYLQCRGQIRFGDSGARAARTLSLVEPCTQLVKDGRSGASVDLVLGTGFDGLRLSAPAKRAMHEISLVSARRGGQRAAGSAASRQVSREVLNNAHDARC
jgi:hypothetical protein